MPSLSHTYTHSKAERVTLTHVLLKSLQASGEVRWIRQPEKATSSTHSASWYTETERHKRSGSEQTSWTVEDGVWQGKKGITSTSIREESSDRSGGGSVRRRCRRRMHGGEMRIARTGLLKEGQRGRGSGPLRRDVLFWPLQQTPQRPTPPITLPSPDVCDGTLRRNRCTLRFCGRSAAVRPYQGTIARGLACEMRSSSFSLAALCAMAMCHVASAFLPTSALPSLSRSATRSALSGLEMMRHGCKDPKLGLPADHRKALLRSLTTEVIRHGRITTTMARAKALRDPVRYRAVWEPAYLELARFTDWSSAKLMMKASHSDEKKWSSSGLHRFGGACFTRAWRPRTFKCGHVLGWFQRPDSYHAVLCLGSCFCQQFWISWRCFDVDQIQNWWNRIRCDKGDSADYAKMWCTVTVQLLCTIEFRTLPSLSRISIWFPGIFDRLVIFWYSSGFFVCCALLCGVSFFVVCQVDHMITLAKDGSLHARRQALGYVYDKELVHALFEQVHHCASSANAVCSLVSTFSAFP